jgi:gamma-glutamylcyclotransferase (GGCT)/AIG2-like uncharacterized protein YtfP
VHSLNKNGLSFCPTMMPPGAITTTTGSTAAMNKIFVYGTLMAESVVTTLIGRMPPHDKARVVGYVRYPVRDRVYPAIIPVTTPHLHPAAAVVVEGLLLRDLHEGEMRRLDWFEGTDYRRVNVRVELLHSATATTGEPESSSSTTTPTKDESAQVAESSSSTSTTSLLYTLAYMYEWNNPVEMLDTTRAWDYEDFLQNHLDGYVDESELPPPP